MNDNELKIYLNNLNKTQLLDLAKLCLEKESTKKVYEIYLRTFSEEKLKKIADKCFDHVLDEKKIHEPGSKLKEGYSIQTNFDNINTCEKAKNEYMKNKKNTNYKYKNFTQSIFNAGDVKQFKDLGINKTLFPLITKKKVPKKNVWKMSRNPNVKYEFNIKNIESTFHYLFKHLKKGIYVQIYDNNLNIFLPFNDVNYKNIWSEQLKPPKKFKGNTYKYALDNTRINKYSNITVSNRPNSWYANNCLFRNTIYNHKNPKDLRFKTDEGDKSSGNFLLMLETLCKERDIPNIEFFINYRDFPLLKKDFSDPYDALWGPKGKAPDLKKLGYTKPKIPIMSQSNTDKFEDILVPTDDDMERTLGRYTFPFCRKIPSEMKQVPWEDKVSYAIFRGGLTGCNTTIEHNARLKLSYLSRITNKYFDAGLTGFNMRIKKDPTMENLTIVDPESTVKLSGKPSDYDIQNSKFVPIKIKDLRSDRIEQQKQVNYKYIIDAAGHVSGFRLSLEMSFGSVILKVQTPYKIWFEKSLVPLNVKRDNYEKAHYIPINKNLKNLIPTIKWCHENDSKCKQISENAKEFYNTFLTRKGVLDFWENTLIKLAK
jgi:hypothetical protein